MQVAIKVVYKDVETHVDQLDKMVFVDLNRRLSSDHAPKYIEYFEDSEYLYSVT